MIPTGTIGDIISHKGAQVWSVTPETSVFDAVSLLAEKNVGALLVLDHERLAGILSERDYTRKVILKGKTSRETKVGEIYSPKARCISTSQTVEEGMRMMSQYRIRHLPVVDGERLVGIVSIGDLVNWLLSAQTTAIEQLQTYIGGVPAQR